MHYSSRAFTGVVAALCASSVSAQTIAPVAVAPAQTVILTSIAPNVLRAGTPVALRMSEGLTTQKKKLRTGHRFQMEVAEAVVVNGITIIPAGSPATGEVTQIRNKGMWGKSGYIGAQALFVRANGRQIRVTGQFDDKGVTGTGAVIGAIALIPVAGFFMTGTSAQIPAGSSIKAFIDEDISFATEATAAPMMVSTPAPAPTVAVVPAATLTPVSVVKTQ